MAAEELSVGFNPVPAAERVANYQAMIRSRLTWLGVAGVICVGIYFWQRAYLTPLATVLLFVVGLGGSLAWVGFALVMRWLCRRSLAQVGEGEALALTPEGIRMAGRLVAWAAIERVTTAPGPICVGARLVVWERGGWTFRVPLSHIDTLPGTLDNALRVFSGGGVSLEVAHLDN